MEPPWRPGRVLFSEGVDGVRRFAAWWPGADDARRRHGLRQSQHAGSALDTVQRHAALEIGFDSCANP
jgi:hypothetical protein